MSQYYLKTGEADRLRLERLGKIYNPFTQYFLQRHGLKPGMHVLEYGCGTGDMLCWLAQQVGPTGRVVGIDAAEDQIEICREKVKEKRLNNVELHTLKIEDIASLNQTFDIAFGRWVLLFLANPTHVAEQILNHLKPRGTLIIETCEQANSGIHSEPEHPVFLEWRNMVERAFTSQGLSAHFATDVIKHFKTLPGLTIHAECHQPILMTEEEKSVLRLGNLSNKDSLVNKLKLMTEAEADQMIDTLAELEKIQNTVIWFYNNTLIALHKS